VQADQYDNALALLLDAAKAKPEEIRSASSSSAPSTSAPATRPRRRKGVPDALEKHPENAQALKLPRLHVGRSRP